MSLANTILGILVVRTIIDGDIDVIHVMFRVAHGLFIFVVLLLSIVSGAGFFWGCVVAAIGHILLAKLDSVVANRHSI